MGHHAGSIAAFRNVTIGKLTSLVTYESELAKKKKV